jgi:hypothetical protein
VFSSAEVMDPERGTWQLLPVAMSSARKYGAACSLGGCLFVAGGMDEKRTRLASGWLQRPAAAAAAAAPDALGCRAAGA